MRGKVRYFFWSTIASAVLLIFSSFNNKAQMKMLGALQYLKQGTVQSLPTAVQARLPDSFTENSSANEVRHVEELNESSERVSSSHNEYIAPSGESYVLIEGKYYKAQKDNIYQVNGRRVYYVNNRRYSQNEAQGNLAEDESTAYAGDETTPQPAPKLKRQASATMLQPLDTADVPMSPEEALKKMQEAQQRIKERDDYVDSLGY